MANIVARILEKRIGKLFSNFHAGKNASSSLLKGEGTATDLEFNKSLINSFLPLNIAVTRATCKLLKWRLSLVSKAPVSLVFTGVQIEVQVLPPEQARSAWTKRKKRRSKKDKESKSKKQAILQGIKLQLQDVHLKVLMLAEDCGPGTALRSAHERPYLELEVAQMRVHSANSQWHEVSDLSKVYVINPAVGEATSFKKLELSGCTVRLYHPAATLSQSTRGLRPSAGGEPAVLWDSVTVQAKLSTKRRCTTWEVLAFKLDLEIPHLSCSMSRLQVFMLKMVVMSMKQSLAAAKDLVGATGKTTLTKNHSNASLDDDDDEAGEADEDDVAGLDSILEQQGELLSEEWEWGRSGLEQWCSHIDNSINIEVKHAEIHAVPEEMGQDEGSGAESGLLFMVAGLTVAIWPAQTSLKKVNRICRREMLLAIGSGWIGSRGWLPGFGI